MYRWMAQKRKEENRFLLRLIQTPTTQSSKRTFVSSILFYTSKRKKIYTNHVFVLFLSRCSSWRHSKKCKQWPSYKIIATKLSAPRSFIQEFSLFVKWFMVGASALRTPTILSWILQTQLICDSLNSQSLRDMFTCLFSFLGNLLTLFCDRDHW